MVDGPFLEEGGSGSSKKQVRGNFQTDKQKELGGGGQPPYTRPHPDPPLHMTSHNFMGRSKAYRVGRVPS